MDIRFGGVSPHENYEFISSVHVAEYMATSGSNGIKKTEIEAAKEATERLRFYGSKFGEDISIIHTNLKTDVVYGVENNFVGIKATITGDVVRIKK